VNKSGLPRQLIVIGVAVPLALLVGYLLATPDRLQTMTIVGLVLAVLISPVLLHFHYPILLFSWSAVVVVFFLPGKPDLWMVIAGISLAISVLTKVLNKEARFQNVSSVTWPLAFLVLVVLVTAKLTGGVGLRALGNETFGGKQLVFILAAVIGYFAISNYRIPPERIKRYTALFFLAGLTAAIPNLLYMAGPLGWRLFLLFPTNFALNQAFDDFALGAADVKFTRLTGFTFASMAAFAYAMMRFGLRGMLMAQKPWRFVLFCVVGALGLLGGFRSAVIIFGLVCAAQFYFEGLHRTRLFLVLLIAMAIGGAALIPLAPKLPLSVQRSLSMLPLKIDPVAKIDAQASLEWRIEMWKILVPQIPQYFWIGKGYALSPSDLYLSNEAARRGLMKSYELAAVSGNYHSGPLSILIPFGVFGMIGFLWFLIASVRVLYINHRYSPPQYQNLNTFLLSYFVARALFYFVGMGALSSDLPFFAGLIGLSIAVNGGVRSRAVETVPSATVPQPDVSMLENQPA